MYLLLHYCLPHYREQNSNEWSLPQYMNVGGGPSLLAADHESHDSDITVSVVTFSLQAFESIVHRWKLCDCVWCTQYLSVTFVHTRTCVCYVQPYLYLHPYTYVLVCMYAVYACSYSHTVWTASSVHLAVYSVLQCSSRAFQHLVYLCSGFM